LQHAFASADWPAGVPAAGDSGEGLLPPQPLNAPNISPAEAADANVFERFNAMGG
jgi:hypothetical protein